MLVISIPSDDLCLQPKLEVNINGWATFVIVAVEREASFYCIHDRQNVLASNIF